MDKIIDFLADRIIYGWHTKKAPKTIGLINLIGTPSDPNPEFSAEAISNIWESVSSIDEAELFMDVGKVYLKLSSLLKGRDDIRIRWGAWIKIPNDKHKYLNAHKEHSKQLSLNRKRKFDDDDYDRNNNNSSYSNSSYSNNGNKPPLLIQHDLLESRTLSQLYDLTKSDGYIQLGDVTFTFVY
jgi:hypothetical protein